jgi:RNA polymerase sigma-70 factor (ECF subfamily)
MSESFKPAIDDVSLVKAFQAGESAENAFDALVLKYKDRVFNLCYRFLGDREEANDCAQETFVKVYRSLKGFRLESAFSTWLYRITVNACKNKLASAEYRYKRKTVSMDAPVQNDSGEDCLLQIGDESLSPVTLLEKSEKNRLIQDAIESLPEDQRKVIILRDIEQRPYEEISLITGYNLGTVKSRISRARRALSEKLRRLV